MSSPPPLPFSDQLDLVHLLYDVAYLEARERAGMRLSPAERLQLNALCRAFGGDNTERRSHQRRHRRLPMMLPAVVKIGTRFGRATILNMSGGGMLLAASIGTLVGDKVLVKVARPGSVQYSFPCTVRRLTHERGAFHMALAITGIPLELRYNDSGDDEESEELPFCASAGR